MKRTIAITTLLFSLAIAACGGKSKPADTAGGGGEEKKMAGGCCCEFVEETMIGDGSEDTAENQVRRMMSGQECEQNSGTCVAAADQNECEAGNEPPPAAGEGGDEETVGD
ncbi:MAG TPA: hypothetical protein VM261_05570 [Kofleriaceae bacterium]|nr:hypothetical protein [Kofleriaceae bacterium]